MLSHRTSAPSGNKVATPSQGFPPLSLVAPGPPRLANLAPAPSVLLSSQTQNPARLWPGIVGKGQAWRRAGGDELCDRLHQPMTVLAPDSETPAPTHCPAFDIPGAIAHLKQISTNLIIHNYCPAMSPIRDRDQIPANFILSLHLVSPSCPLVQQRATTTCTNNMPTTPRSFPSPY